MNDNPYASPHTPGAAMSAVTLGHAMATIGCAAFIAGLCVAGYCDWLSHAKVAEPRWCVPAIAVLMLTGSVMLISLMGQNQQTKETP